MAQQTINVNGLDPAGTGSDPAKTAFTKTNTNFNELYAWKSGIDTWKTGVDTFMGGFSANGKTLVGQTFAQMKVSLAIAIADVSGLQTALDAKIGTTGAQTMSGALSVGGLKVAGAAASIGVQGCYIQWNAGDGLSGGFNSVCNRGLGGGGFSWRSVNSDNSASGPTMTYSYAGVLNVPGGVTNVSDRRAKEDIEDLALEECEAIADQLVPKSYRRIVDDPDRVEPMPIEYGFIAQDVLEFCSVLVSGDESMYGLNYTGIIPVLAGALKVKSARLKQAESRLDELERRLQALEAVQ